MSQPTHLQLGEIGPLLRRFGNQGVPPGPFALHSLNRFHALLLLVLQALQHELVGVLAAIPQLLWGAAHELLLGDEVDVLFAEFGPVQDKRPLVWCWNADSLTSAQRYSA